MNKKALSLLAVLALGASAGCTPKATEYTVGLGYTVSFDTSKNQVGVTTAFAAFDKDGKIYDVRFDVVQINVALNEAGDGLVTTSKVDAEGSVRSKLELGSEYGMVQFGGAIAEVNAQIEAFADWCAGKTVEEVIAGTPGAGHGEAVNEELANSVTIGVDDFDAALTSAFANKTTTTYELTGTAGIAMVTGVSGFEVTVNTAGVFAKDGVVEADLIDAIVVPIAVAEGAYSIDASKKYVAEDGTILSKKVLGDDYAMKGIGKNYTTGETCTAEWYEQAAVIETAAIGKTASQIKALVAGEGELAGATVTVTDYLGSLAKATDYAGKTVINAN